MVNRKNGQISSKVIITIFTTVILILTIMVGGFIYFMFLSGGEGTPQSSLVYSFETKGSSDGEVFSKGGLKEKGFLQQSIKIDCNPEYPYTSCDTWKEINSWGDATSVAEVKVQISNDFTNQQKQGYYVGEVSIPYSVEADESYFTENEDSWDSLWQNNCDKNGCSGETISGFGDRVLARVGEQYIGCPVFYGWDYDRDDAPNGDWSWSWVTGGRGWVGGDACLDIKSVECVDNSDCSFGLICDVSGDWTQWSCVQEETETVFIYQEEENECVGIEIKVSEKSNIHYNTIEDCNINIKTDYLGIVAMGIVGVFIIGIIFIIVRIKRN